MSAKEKREQNQRRIDAINAKTGAMLFIDFAPYYGGYCLEAKQGQYRLCARMPLNEFTKYVLGMYHAIDLLPKL